MSHLWHLIAVLQLASTAGDVPSQDRLVIAGQRAVESAGLRENSPLARPAGLNVRNTPLPEALVQLSFSAGVPIAFSSMMLPAGRSVSCACEGISVGDALGILLADTDLQYAE